MKINDYDKALADYEEAIKTIRRDQIPSLSGYIYELRAITKRDGRYRCCA